MHISVRQIVSFGLAFLIAPILASCQITMNGMTLKPAQLANARRIVLVSLAGDTISYRSQGWLNSDYRTLNTAAWDLDSGYGQPFADALSSSFTVKTAVYSGPRRDSLKKIYVDNPVGAANRFAWKAVEEDLRAIAKENDATYVALVLREEFQDELAKSQFFVKGLGVSSGRGVCAAFANLTLTIIDGSTGAPTAGSNVYATTSEGKILSNRIVVPDELCDQQLQNLTPQQSEFLRRLFGRMLTPLAIRQSVDRLVSK